jgi:predicted ABC-class ATPase
MGIQKGVNVIVGGGFHGKSTLLSALQLGVYDKIPGDGREFCVCDESAVKIRAEDGRAVTAVDITSFITNLPFGKLTNNFTSMDASGSTSQASNIIEVRSLRTWNRPTEERERRWREY